MLRYAAGILCLLGSLALLYAGLRTPPKPAIPPAPDFTVDTPVKDFGEVDQFSELPATFTLTNTHPEPVEVLSVMKSCACASDEVTPKVIPPGGTGTLKTVWKVGNGRGKKGAGLGVLFSVGGKPAQLVNVQMVANVIPAVQFEPEGVEFDEGKARSVTVRLIARSEVSAINAQADTRYFRVMVSDDRRSMTCEYTGVPVDQATNSFSLVVRTTYHFQAEWLLPIQIRRTPSQLTTGDRP